MIALLDLSTSFKTHWLKSLVPDWISDRVTLPESITIFVFTLCLKVSWNDLKLFGMIVFNSFAVFLQVYFANFI